MVAKVPVDIQMKMVAAYQSGLSNQAAAATFGYCGAACQFALRKFGIKSRSRGEYRRRHHFNERFFRDIQTEAQAYVLGFVTADGAVENRSLRIQLASADRQHLEKIKEALGASVPIHDSTYSRGGVTYHRSRISLNSTALAADLAAFGIVPNKTFTVRPWDGPLHLMRHYYRGLFDGDGCIARNCRSGGWIINCVGNAHIAAGYADFAASVTGVRRKPRPSKSVWQVAYGRLRDAQALLKAMYEGATIALDRKRLLAEQCLAHVRETRDWTWLTAEHLLAAREQAGTWLKVSKDLGINWSDLWRYRKRLGLL